jgi:phosphate transport system substrate-binding protein
VPAASASWNPFSRLQQVEKRTIMQRPAIRFLTSFLLFGAAVSAGCVRTPRESDASQTVVRVEGSDTMVNVAQAWAERYHAENPQAIVQVLGGGSGVGIASLTDANCDLANSSRDISAKESAAIREKRKAAPREHVVGYDALAVFVHPNNPLDSIAMEELAGIFGEEGAIVRWSQLGAKIGPYGRDVIVRLGRQNSSGTYTYFREAVLGKKKEFKLGSVDRCGSQDLVALVAKTPLAIGYSGMGYAFPGVKMLRVSKKKGEPGIAPTLANAMNRSYPLTRALLIYSVGESPEPVARYLTWIASPAGQAIVGELGYVPAGATE